MDIRKLNITPVKREDFSINFGSKKGLATSNPEAFFAPAIKQFKKLAVGRYCWFVPIGFLSYSNRYLPKPAHKGFA